jgi:hypothetical protein
MDLLAFIFNLIIQRKFINSNAINIIKLMEDRVMLFKTKLYELYSSKLNDVINTCAIEVI